MPKDENELFSNQIRNGRYLHTKALLTEIGYLDGAKQVKAIPLKRLLDKHEIETLLKEFSRLSSSALTIGVADAEGRWLAVHPSAPTDSSLLHRACDAQREVADEHATALPLVAEGTLYGFLYGYLLAMPLLRVLQRTLSMLIQKALTQKALAKETLDRYREINLLYRVHETVGASVDLDEVIHRVLEESTRIIKANGGSVLLSDSLTDQLLVCNSVGLDVASAEQSLISQAFSEKVFKTGKSRILNDLQRHVRPGDADEVQLVSLLCAPLKSAERVLGVITLARTRAGEMFTAGDEKLLTALASQAGIAIANAREVQVRERRLKQQIDALRIEIDEAKKQREVFAITESEYFDELQKNAQKMRAEFDI